MYDDSNKTYNIFSQSNAEFRSVQQFAGYKFTVMTTNGVIVIVIVMDSVSDSIIDRIGT